MSAAERVRHALEHPTLDGCMRAHWEGPDDARVLVKCKCCEERKPCAGILQLTPAQWTQIARVEAMIGTAQSWVRSASTRTAEQRKAAEAEPMTRVECPVCEREFEMFTYLVEFLEQQHAPFPRCEGCVDRVKREAKRAA